MRSGKRLRLLLPLLPLPLIGTAAAQVGERVVERMATSVPAPRGTGPLRAATLSGHNDARAAAGVAPLIWDERLAASARDWAWELADGSLAPRRPARGRAGAGRDGRARTCGRARAARMPMPRWPGTGRRSGATS